VANDFRPLWEVFTETGATDWLTDDVKAQYREVWRAGLDGALNYYRASPLRPPTSDDQAVMEIRWPPETLTVGVPTLVVWAEGDTALLPGLLEGLEAFVPHMRVVRVPDATHWIVHERPALLAREIQKELERDA
jgi:epoxide hydrolase 4